MKTFTCPRCTEVLTVTDNQDFIVCSRCGNTLFVSNFIDEIIDISDESHDLEDERTSGLPE